MPISIYKKIDADSCGGDEVMEDYAAYLQDTLLLAYPDASIEIETTTRESGVMPTVITGATFAEEREIQEAISAAWDEFCRSR